MNWTPFTVLTWCALAAARLSALEPGFVSLFDGRTLAGWDGDPRFWSVEGGVIVGRTTADNPTARNTFLIWQRDEPADFELKLEFKLLNHNSGVQYRSTPVEGQDWMVAGYQADIAADPVWMGAVYGEPDRGLLAARGQKTVVGGDRNGVELRAEIGDPSELLAHVRMDGWNELHIIAQGNQCIQMVNGVTVAAFAERGERREAGRIALQLHAGPPMEVRFRNLRLRMFEPDSMKRVLFLAGPSSHGPGAHEHRAGCELLARCLNESGLDVIAAVATEGAWPEPWLGYAEPDAVVLYCDGLDDHVARTHRDRIQRLVDAGVGVVCLHFAVEVDPAVLGAEFLDWIGGYFEAGWSVNPFWTPRFETLPDHPVARGVAPFSIRDEWYYHMRFRPGMEGVSPILSAVPPLRSLTSRAKDRLRGSNPDVMAAVHAGQSQHVAWAYQRSDGGRGFGFTGGHYHQIWQHDAARKLVLNGIAWTARVDIPDDGVYSRKPSDSDMRLNVDPALTQALAWRPCSSLAGCACGVQ